MDDYLPTFTELKDAKQPEQLSLFMHYCNILFKRREYTDYDHDLPYTRSMSEILQQIADVSERLSWVNDYSLSEFCANLALHAQKFPFTTVGTYRRIEEICQRYENMSLNGFYYRQTFSVNYYNPEGACIGGVGAVLVIKPDCSLTIEAGERSLEEFFTAELAKIRKPESTNNRLYAEEIYRCLHQLVEKDPKRYWLEKPQPFLIKYNRDDYYEWTCSPDSFRVSYDYNYHFDKLYTSEYKVVELLFDQLPKKKQDQLLQLLDLARPSKDEWNQQIFPDVDREDFYRAYLKVSDAGTV